VLKLKVEFGLFTQIIFHHIHFTFRTNHVENENMMSPLL